MCNPNDSRAPDIKCVAAARPSIKIRSGRNILHEVACNACLPTALPPTLSPSVLNGLRHTLSHSYISSRSCRLESGIPPVTTLIESIPARLYFFRAIYPPARR